MQNILIGNGISMSSNKCIIIGDNAIGPSNEENNIIIGSKACLMGSSNSIILGNNDISFAKCVSGWSLIGDNRDKIILDNKPN